MIQPPDDKASKNRPQGVQEISEFKENTLNRNKRPASVTVGNFDGIHLGHQRLLSKAIIEAKEIDGDSVALTFSPRPEAWFQKCKSESLIFTDHQKSKAMEEFGITTHKVQPFDDAFSQISHLHFITNILRNRLNARSVVVGENFRFGFRRLGDPEYLTRAGKEFGFKVSVIDAAIHSGQAISSSRTRSAVESGDVELASSLLGRPFLLEGTVVKGDKIGRTLGFPTANLGNIHQLIPGNGVYAARLALLDKGSNESGCKILNPNIDSMHAAVVNIGHRPSVGEKLELRIEAHAIDANFLDDELYGRRLGLYFAKKIRSEIKFNDLAHLKERISLDTQIAKDILS